MDQPFNFNRNTKRVFVVGHMNPDTDSIASAIGYAWLLNVRDDLNTLPARAGAINRQTAWVLKTLGIESPVLLTDASPRFESVMRRYDVVSPDKSLNEAWTILTRTAGICPVVNQDGTPFGMVTGQSVFDFMRKIIGPHAKNRNITIAEMLDIPCREAAEIDLPKFAAGTRIKDVLNRLLRNEQTEYWVIDENKRYLGVVKQRDLLSPPRIQVILVDHNEPQQAIASLEEAELLEILDHHRLGNQSTHNPIKFTVDIVGSTSTLVSEQMEESGLSAPPDMAGLLLAGLLSDTLILTSPTTTSRDNEAAQRLARWAFVPGSPLEDETIKTYGERIVKAGAGLITQEPDVVVSTDMKLYETAGFKFAIAQAETSDMYDIGDYIPRLQAALKNLKNQKAIDFAGLMVTDVVAGSSRLIFVDAPPELDELPYKPMSDGTYVAEGVVSRKKQLLPIVLSLLEV
ncbi:MAG TPA: DHH family phosphoesterase [Anaerolineaceae bacterium]|nr:CBS domain-containing protein [Chloroflexota bacterium]HNY83475.1 DHH family phosphoesterase [Anaerolineaceae bacterium]